MDAIELYKIPAGAGVRALSPVGGEYARLEITPQGESAYFLSVGPGIVITKTTIGGCTTSITAGHFTGRNVDAHR